MNIQNWNIFNKNGSPIGWTPSPLLNLVFTDSTGKDAEGYIITDVSGYPLTTEITNGGYLYTAGTTTAYSYYQETINHSLTSSDASIRYTDVSVFGSEYPNGLNTKSINDVILDISTSFVYPSVTYAAALFLEPISQGLIETEYLYILESSAGAYIRPYDGSNNTLVFEFIGDDSEIQFFEVNENTTELTWSSVLVYDISAFIPNRPIQLNIGFKSEFEGVFERTLRVYHLVGNTLYTMADIIVNAEAIGEDERFRSLISNFGLPDPKDIQQVFKETDINEDLPDWEILNYKSKHIILEHDKIMPFIGTYKGLINAIKWLGYDDITIREWFLNVKENKKISFVVSFDADDSIDSVTGLKTLGRTRTILMFDADQRRAFKKLNQLSLNYCITRETGEYDEWGTPETEDCYSYNLKEVFIKLLGLKRWLEKNIIGVNCRITDITGEGIYFERVQNLIYATDNVGYNYEVEQPLTPYSPDVASELVSGDASVRLTFLELTRTPLKTLNHTFAEMAESAWNPYDSSAYNWPDASTPYKFVSLDDPSYIANSSDYLLIGATFGYPFSHVSDIMWRLSVEKDNAGVIGSPLVTNPLFVYENELRFYNIFDSSSIFIANASTDLTILLEKGYLREDSSIIDVWTDAIAYSFYPNACDNGYILESSTGAITKFNSYITFTADTSAKLQYAYDSNYKVPLLSFQYFKTIDASNSTLKFGNKIYYLDILDGKIEMNAGNILNSSDNTRTYLNFQYDTSLEEQMLTVNV
jgi:hypothetical protein